MEQKWQNSIDNLNKRREAVVAAGGLDRIAKQHSSGKLTARERMDALFDDGTFVEINDMITSRATDFGLVGPQICLSLRWTGCVKNPKNTPGRTRAY